MKVLLDSNVVIAAVVREHVHNVASKRLLDVEQWHFLLPAHALAEVYNQLTRPARVFVEVAPVAVARLLRQLLNEYPCRALTVEETMAAISSFAALGGRGARLYDYLIGYVGQVENVDAIATWNVRHFTPLFPSLRVVTPDQLLES